MTLIPQALTLAAIFCCVITARAETSLSETRTTLEKWVETRQLISKTRTDWQSDKEMIGQTIVLLERELASVEEKMTRLGTNSVQVEKERLEAEAQLESSNAALSRAHEFAAGFEGQLRALLPRLPMPLQEIVRPLLARLPADSNSTKMAATERMQVIVGILNEFDKFNSSVGIFSEKRTNDKGEEVAVETVYVGLGAAYFVNEAGDVAGLGSPGANGWEWVFKPELAASVREVIRIYRNERPARFIPLPAVIR